VDGFYKAGRVMSELTNENIRELLSLYLGQELDPRFTLSLPVCSDVCPVCNKPSDDVWSCHLMHPKCVRYLASQLTMFKMKVLIRQRKQDDKKDLF
jgi:hypothetical protein